MLKASVKLKNGFKNRYTAVPPNSRRSIESQPFAFSAYLGHNIPHTAVGHTIKCDQIILNYGNGYNAYTGVFTVRITGLYLFTFNIAVYNPNKYIGVRLVVDNRGIVDVIAGTHPYMHTMAGNTAIIQVNENESVWLESFSSSDGEVISDPNSRVTTFSGALLYAL